MMRLWTYSNPYSGRCCNRTGGFSAGGDGSRGYYGRRRSGCGSPLVPLQLNLRKLRDNSPSWY